MTEEEAELLVALKRLVHSCERVRAFTDPKYVLNVGRLNFAREVIARAEART